MVATDGMYVCTRRHLTVVCVLSILLLYIDATLMLTGPVDGIVLVHKLVTVSENSSHLR